MAAINKKRIVIVGLGEIGTHTLKELLKKDNLFDIIAVDNDKSKFDRNLPVKYSTSLGIPADIFVVAVYSSEDVLNVANKINYSNHPLVLIESTINPEICSKIEKQIVTSNKSYMAYFPQRYNKGDKKHQIFNQKRVIGPVNEKSKKMALNFLSNFMRPDDIIITSSQTAALSKIVENSHRFVEIALAEEIALYCKENNIAFEELRRCVNSKWNMDMKEARQGIYGKCLSKDIRILNTIFNRNLLLASAIKADKKYKNKFKKIKLEGEKYASRFKKI